MDKLVIFIHDVSNANPSRFKNKIAGGTSGYPEAEPTKERNLYAICWLIMYNSFWTL